jgi:hypothetical protein
MIRRAVAVALLLTFSGTPVVAGDGNEETAPISRSIHVESSSRGALPALYVTLAGLQAYDGFSTFRSVRNGGVEANPLMRNFAGNPAAVFAVKGGVTAASILVCERLWKQNRRTAAIMTMIATNGLMAAVVARNASMRAAR